MTYSKYCLSDFDSFIKNKNKISTEIFLIEKKVKLQFD